MTSRAAELVIGQLADMPTHGLFGLWTGQVVDWTACGPFKSQSSEIADWTGHHADDPAESCN